MDHRRRLQVVFAVIGLMAAPVCAVSPDDFDQHPLPDDLVLPMPNGARMVFRPVFLGTGTDGHATRGFRIGDRTGQHGEEPLRQASVGGSFIAERNGHQDWLYYIGKFVVTEAQFTAVCAAPAGQNQVAPRSHLPQTKLTRREMDDFVDKYNAWLLKNAPGQLPEYSGARGYLRLPTEEEWEFAARGGNAATVALFDAVTPYNSDLQRYEWFAGPHSSFGKLKDVGLLDPNPLGLYDMLGNVAEMTDTMYEFAGRTGGYTVRGGSFRTPEEDIRASLRTEQPRFGRDNQPIREETVGFRLIIASQIITDQNRSEIKAAETQQRTDRWAAEKNEDDEVAHLAEEKRKLELAAAAVKVRADEAERLAAEQSKELEALKLAEEKNRGDEAKQKAKLEEAQNQMVSLQLSVLKSQRSELTEANRKLQKLKPTLRTKEDPPVLSKSRRADLAHSVTFILESVRFTHDQTIAVNGSLSNNTNEPTDIYSGVFVDQRYTDAGGHQNLQVSAIDQSGNQFAYQFAEGFSMAESGYTLQRPAIYVGKNQFVSIRAGESAPVTLYLASKHEIEGASKFVDLHLEFLVLIGESTHPLNKTIGFRNCPVQ